MQIRASWCSRALVLGAFLFTAGTLSRAEAQTQQHVVSLDELKTDAAKPAQTRHAEEAAVKDFLSSDPAQKVLKSANFDLRQVDKAVSQLSDEDLARLAEKSRQAKQDFAAGNLSDHDLILIVLVILVALIVALAVR
jgi:hypothetical protein